MDPRNPLLHQPPIAPPSPWSNSPVTPPQLESQAVFTIESQESPKFKFPLKIVFISLVVLICIALIGTVSISLTK